MKRRVAQFWRGQSNGSLVLVGLACSAAGGLALALGDLTTLRRFGRVLALLLATGGVALGLAAVRWTRDQMIGSSRARWLTVAGLSASLLCLAAFAIYSNGFYWKRTRSLCWAAGEADTISLRRAALEEGLGRTRSAFSILPELTGFRVSRDCAAAARDLDRIEQGRCPYSLVRAVPCVCGDEKWAPGYGRCERPQCVVSPERERFRCPGDPW